MCEEIIVMRDGADRRVGPHRSSAHAPESDYTRALLKARASVSLDREAADRRDRHDVPVAA